MGLEIFILIFSLLLEIFLLKILLILIGLLFVLKNGYILIKRWYLLKNGKKQQVIVKNITNHRNHTRLYLDYFNNEKFSKYQKVGKTVSPEIKVGETVEIAYMENRPKIIIISDHRIPITTKKYLRIILIIFGIFLILLSTFLSVWGTIFNI